MSKIDLKQLVKILNLTMSDNDHEALAAMRIAQSHMKKANIDWQTLLNQSIDKPVTKAAPKQSRFKPMPSTFDFGWFRAAMECDEFHSFLSNSDREWVNQVVRYANSHRYVPQKHWTVFIGIWDDFRESRG